MEPTILNSDEILLEKLRQGDKEAYAVIFERSWLDLYKYAVKKIKDKDDAQEIVQNLFLELWEDRQKLTNINLNHFLLVCVRNKCVDYIRKKILQGKYVDHCKKFSAIVNMDTEESISVNDIAQQVEVGLNTLPEKSQMVFRLSRYEGFNTKEIAERVQLSEKAVEYHLTKALKTLRVCLKDFVLGILIYFSL